MIGVVLLLRLCLLIVPLFGLALLPAKLFAADVAAAPPHLAQIATLGAAPAGTLEEAQHAVVRIEAVGVQISPLEGTMIGSGTGFIIDGAGRVVTNNHVVTGAAYYRVYMLGRDEPVNARLLAASECADLAVLELPGSDYPYVAWHTGVLRVGMEVYAAGYPRGEQEYVLTKGGVRRVRSTNNSNWAAVGQVLLHNAPIDHGNSGGPLLTAGGEVVGVNYAGNLKREQYYALGLAGVRPILQQLLEGVSVDSIGINAQAFRSDDGEIYGIWIASVRSGSPADRTGIRAGDVLRTLEGLPVAEDGTLATYCDILRSHDPADVLGVTVLRLATGDMLEGQLNGRVLEVTENISVAPLPAPTPPPTVDFTTVTDATGRIRLRVPVAWNDVASGEWLLDDEPLGVKLEAAPDLEKFNGYWNAPGLYVRLVEEWPGRSTMADVLDIFELEEECTYEDRYRYQSSQLQGEYDVWKECGGGRRNRIYILAARPANAASDLVLLSVQLSGAQEDDLFKQIAGSLAVVPAPGRADPTAGAVVKVDALNVRSGPGINYSRLGGVVKGDRLLVRGQVNSCGWILVITPSGLRGWVSGDPRYVNLELSCHTVPAAEAAAPLPLTKGASRHTISLYAIAQAPLTRCFILSGHAGIFDIASWISAGSSMGMKRSASNR
jgi:serine protease Do